MPDYFQSLVDYLSSYRPSNNEANRDAKVKYWPNIRAEYHLMEFGSFSTIISTRKNDNMYRRFPSHKQSN